MTSKMTEPLCTCGKRPKHKCCEEFGVGGKMCLKCGNKDFDELTERLWKEHPQEMAETRIWAQECTEEIKLEPINRRSHGLY